MTSNVLTVDLLKIKVFQLLLDYLITYQYEIINKQDTYLTGNKPYPSYIKVSLGSTFWGTTGVHGGHGNIKINMIPTNSKTQVKWKFEFTKGYIRTLLCIIAGVLILFTKLNVYSYLLVTILSAFALFFFLDARSEKKKFTKGITQLFAKYTREGYARYDITVRELPAVIAASEPNGVNASPYTLKQDSVFLVFTKSDLIVAKWYPTVLKTLTLIFLVSFILLLLPSWIYMYMHVRLNVLIDSGFTLSSPSTIFLILLATFGSGSIILISISLYVYRKRGSQISRLPEQGILKNYKIKHKISLSDIKNVEMNNLGERGMPMLDVSFDLWSLLISTDKENLTFFLKPLDVFPARTLLQSIFHDKFKMMPKK